MPALVGTAALPSPPVIYPGCRVAMGAYGLSRFGFGAPASGTSPWSDAANCLLAWPFVLESMTTFYKGCWLNGTAAGGNWEVGIWDGAYNKITTTGSVVGSGNSVPQSAALAATVILSPGSYFMGIAHSATTTGQVFQWPITTTGAGILQSFGCWKQAAITLGSLAATATPADLTNIAWPVYGLITRSVFDV